MTVLKAKDANGNWIPIVSGPKGDPGPVGPPGPSGSAGGQRYTHVQSMLASIWLVQHNMNAHPAVFIEDSAGSIIHGTITFVNNNQLTITFAHACTGRVNCT